EWEYAARGPEGRTFPWGEESPVGRAFLWAQYQALYPPNLAKPCVTTVGRFPQGASPEGVHDLIGNASEVCGNYFYDYTKESVGLDPDSFAEYANPSDGDPEIIAEGFFYPHMPIRGHQYVDTYNAATGWVRTGELVGDRKPDDRRAWINVSFRVLREVEPTGDSGAVEEGPPLTPSPR
ncbi:MAG: formylglycine-generating enzyme family protein, partial [bacterium]|nr:formylglycine-generating enzyme family protein [bacterium]